MEEQVLSRKTARRIPFCKVQCQGNEGAYVKEVLESGWLTTAGKTQLFEERFAETVQASFFYDLRIMFRTAVVILLIGLGKRRFSEPPEMSKARMILGQVCPLEEEVLVAFQPEGSD